MGTLLHHKHWRFFVTVDTAPGETVCVIGSCPQLGEWLPHRAVPLVKELQSPGTTEVWSCVVNIAADVTVKYRYCVCTILEPDVQRNRLTREVLVRRWETNLNPRVINVDEPENVELSYNQSPEVFGAYDGQTRIENGWLTSQAIFQLKLFDTPIQIWKKSLQGKQYQIKVTAIDLQKNHFTESFMLASDESKEFQEMRKSVTRWPIVEVAKMTDLECEFKLQEQFGEVYLDNDFMVFQIQVLQPDAVAFMVDFFLHDPVADSHTIPVHFGSCYILSSNMKQAEGLIHSPIMSPKMQPLGQLRVEYLMVRPLTNYECDMSVSFARHWKNTWKGLEVGHRGAGNSFHSQTKNCANVRENTIASLNYAVAHGADFVEFDVQLSKDLVPVIYHDFHICIATKKKVSTEQQEFVEVPLKELTLEQLQMLKVYHVQEGLSQSPKFYDEDLEDHQPFPTLRHALEVSDPHCGFNIEIKWTMQLKDGTYELNHPFEINMYLDTIIKTVLKYAGSRRIVFSCFNPDICTMIRLKQNKYPVAFLTQGVTIKYPDYHDPRTRSIPVALYFAKSAGILGMSVHTEDILRDPSQVEMVTSSGFAIFCWGDDNSNTETIKYLKSLGLNGIIYDRIDEYSCKEIKESIFLVEAREAEKALLKVAERTSDSLSSLKDAPLQTDS